MYPIPNGQKQSMRVPNMQHPDASPPARWGRQAYDISASHHLTTGPSWAGYNVPDSSNPAMDDIRAYQAQLHSIPGYAAGGRSHVALHGRVGSVFDPGVFGTRGLGNIIVQEPPDFTMLNGMRGLRGTGEPWYKNPLYIGLGVVAAAGVAYLTMKKKRR